MPGTQLIVYGHTGSGKSTLVENLLSRVYEKQINTNCMKGMTFEQVVLDAFDELEEFYVDEVTNSKKTVIDSRLKATYLNIQAQIQAKSEAASSSKEKRYLPPQLTPQRLAKLLGEAGYCWVLEDFHKIEGEEKERLAQMMKVFVNLSDKYDDLKVVAIGAVHTAREVVEIEGELDTRVAEFHVELMSDDEIGEIIEKGCDALKIIIPEGLRSDIIHYSNGLGSICHTLCYFMCDTADIKKTLKQPVEFDYTDLQHSLKRYLRRTEDSIKKAFDNAFRLPNIDDTIRILAQQEQDGGQTEELLEWANNSGIKINKKKLETDLKTLELEKNGELVKYNQDSWKFSFSNPFYRAFALAYFESQDDKLRKINKKTDDELLKMLNIAFKTFKSNIAPDDENEP